MPQAKKKAATKTARKTTAKKSGRKSCSKNMRCAQISTAERNHVYLVTAMSIITAILLCANIAMMIV